MQSSSIIIYTPIMQKALRVEHLLLCTPLYSLEVMGAVISVLIIWLITGVLVYEAILRVIHYDKDIDADIMLITACVGVFVNVL